MKAHLMTAATVKELSMIGGQGMTRIKTIKIIFTKVSILLIVIDIQLALENC
jgi:hypothetical protein